MVVALSVTIAAATRQLPPLQTTARVAVFMAMVVLVAGWEVFIRDRGETA